LKNERKEQTMFAPFSCFLSNEVQVKIGISPHFYKKIEPFAYLGKRDACSDDTPYLQFSVPRRRKRMRKRDLETQ
jgi:hypothetical protein